MNDYSTIFLSPRVLSSYFELRNYDAKGSLDHINRSR